MFDHILSRFTEYKPKMLACRNMAIGFKVFMLACGNLIQSLHAGMWQSDPKVSLQQRGNPIAITHLNNTLRTHI